MRIPTFFLLLVLIFLPAMSVAAGGPVVSLTPDPAASPSIFVPLIAHQTQIRGSSRPLIVGLLPDGQAHNDADEAVAVQNIGPSAINLGGWQLTDGEGAITFPDITLVPGDIAWCTRQAVAFEAQIGFQPDCEYEQDTDAEVPDAGGSPIQFANTGDELQLLMPDGYVSDALVFGEGGTTTAGWEGEAVGYYQRSTRFAREGQIFYRLFDPATRLPLADTDTAADWAQANPDPVRGRRAAYPGWDLYEFSQPLHVTWQTPPSARIAVAPDNSFAFVQAALAAAEHSVQIETYEFQHPDLVATLMERAQDGVDVQVLLEGSPAGGLSDDARWAAQQIVSVGGQVDFMVNDVGEAHDRYPFQHAKFAIIDDATLLLGTENFKLGSMPADAGDGDTMGRRGYVLTIDDPALVARARAIFQADDDPAHSDIFPWQSGHPQYGDPPPGYNPPTAPDESGYLVRHPSPLAFADASQAFLFTSPETSLYPGPLLPLIARAGVGDTIQVQQLYEHANWGASTSNPDDDPNPRLEALIDAARRGARVRILLDGFFDLSDGPRGNAATVTYVNQIAQAEGLDLEAKVGNPTLGGVHAKLHLLAIGEERWLVLGSINGGEVSNKLNREMAIAIEAPAAYAYVAGVFAGDWAAPYDWTASPPAPAGGWSVYVE